MVLTELTKRDEALIGKLLQLSGKDQSAANSIAVAYALAKQYSNLRIWGQVNSQETNQLALTLHCLVSPEGLSRTRVRDWIKTFPKRKMTPQDLLEEFERNGAFLNDPVLYFLYWAILFRFARGVWPSELPDGLTNHKDFQLLVGQSETYAKA